MSARRALVLAAGRLALRGFAARAEGFGLGGRELLPRFRSLLLKARAALPDYDAACAAALGGKEAPDSAEEIALLPPMSRSDLAAYKAGGLATLESGGTGSGGRVRTGLDLEAVAARYASLLSVLGETGWKMGEPVAALHPVEYSYAANLPSMLASGQVGRAGFEFLQQYVLYRLVHNRVNVHYSRDIFLSPVAADSLAARAAALKPRLLISRPDALMALLRRLRKGGAAFRELKAVLTVGTVLGESVRKEAEQRLQAPVFNMYASTEIGYAALSCPHSGGWLHSDTAAHHVELSSSGELLCTDLDNKLMPLLRYATGDIGETETRGCLCGRSGRMIKVRGRKDKTLPGEAGPLYELDVIDRAFPSDLPFFQLDASAGSMILPPGAGEREASAVRELLGPGFSSYSAPRGENLRISSSGKFCYLP